MALFTGTILYDLICIVVVLLGIIYGFFQWTYQTWSRKEVPYFKPSFPYGNMQPFHKQIQASMDIFNVIKRAKENGWKYFGMYIIAKPFFVPIDLELVKSILTKDFNHFTDRGFYHNEKDDPMSAHIFAIGGTKWRNLRTKLTPTFTSGKMRTMFQTLADAGVDLEKFLKSYDISKPIDIKTILAGFTTNIIGSCAFGLECKALEEPDSAFVRTGQKVVDFNTLRQIKELFLTSFPNLSKFLHLKMNKQDVIDFYYDIVTKAVVYRENNNYSRNDFLQLLLNIRNNIGDDAKVNKDGEKSLTMDEVVAQCFLFFIAGFETSSTTMSFALYELARHPEVQDRVRKEIFEVLKKYDNKVTYDSIKDLEYMQQALDEALRIYPPIPFVTRQCVADYKVPGTDLILEKGTDVLISLRNIHFYEEYYKNPEEYDPERFSPENKTERHKYAHVPFGEGPRNCIGWPYFGMYLVGKPMFVPIDLDLLKSILTKDFNSLSERGFYYNEKDDPLSAHLFAIGGTKWKNLRAKLTPTFSPGKIRMMFQAMVDAGENFEKFLERYDRSKPINIKPVLAGFTTNVIGSCAFGIECNALEEPNSPFVKYGQKMTEFSTLRRIKDTLTTSFPNIARALHMKAVPSDVKDFYYDVVTKTVDYREKNNFNRNDFLQLLLNIKNNMGDETELNEADGNTLTMDEIVAQCFIFFVGGFETSSTAMMFTFYELARHPEVQELVRKEIFDVLKKHGNKVTYDSIKGLELMQQVLDESLRMYPPLPFITRQCIEDYKVPDTDIILEKGTDILIPIRNIHYCEKYYGNPEEFDPERFSAENKIKRHQYAYIPFGEGPRICIGMRFGKMELQLGLLSVLRNYRIKLSPVTKTPIEYDPATFLVPHIKGGLWLTLEKL